MFEEPILPVDEAMTKALFPLASKEDQLILAALIQAHRLGHLCFKTETVITLESPYLIKKNKTLYLKRFAQCEEQILNTLQALSSPVEALPCNLEDAGLNQPQKEAAKSVLSHSLTLLTGGPGTGKTYTASKIASLFYHSLPEDQQKEFTLILAAPTGKAAEHLKKGFSKLQEEGITLKHGTLHALLNKAYLNASLIIIDECTMIDAFLFRDLLKAICKGSRVLLMGDPYQLPPIGSGNVFKDLIEIAQEDTKIGYAHLTQCMRSDQKEIMAIAEAIKNGSLPDVVHLLENASESVHKLQFFEQNNPSLILKKITDYVSTRFPYDHESDSLKLLEAFEKFKILSCLRKGPLGVNVINEHLKEHFSAKAKSFVAPILITENDRELSLANGQTGVLIFKEEPYALFKDESSPLGYIEIPEALLPSYEYAYCLSVHKAQGSEYDHVLFLAPKGSEIFGKEVLYTALTRAKKQLDIDMASEVLQESLGKSTNRTSNLKNAFFKIS